MPRYTIEFDRMFDKTLCDLVENTDALDKADVIRRAVASYSYLKNQQRANSGAKLVLTDDIQFSRVIELP